MEQKRNILGSQIRKIRYSKGVTQDQLAAKCQIIGYEISRATLSKIEAQIRCITDKEIVAIAKALKVKVEDLF
jgi:transcriptional regulator with XRE-family HTH domain